MNRNFNNPLLYIVLIIVVLLGFGAVMTSSPLHTSSVPVTVPSPTPGSNRQLQLQTFYLDEYHEPLDASTTIDAINRNETRIDATTDQIDSDLILVNQLNKAY